MLISELLALHSSPQAENSDDEILGDAFLLHNNPVYRQIKNHALKIGCHFTEATPEYLLMPFHQLGAIVGNKSIPFVPSGRLLKMVEDKRANALTTEDMKIPESYHLHEAAHIIAEECFAGHEFKDPQEKILKALVCESFANTVDALAYVPVNDDLHRIFLEQNSYMHPEKKDVAIMARLTTSLGPRFTFMFTLLSYLHANFLKEGIPPRIGKELAARYAPETKFSERLFKDCEGLRQMAEKLDPQFRILTTKMYLNLEGYEGDVFKLLNFPFMKVYEANPAFHKAVESMANALLG